MDSSMADGIATRQVPESLVILSAAGTDLPPLHATPRGRLPCILESLPKVPYLPL